MTKDNADAKKLEEIVKLIADGKMTKAFDVINDDLNLLFVLGLTFGEKGNHKVAEKMFHRFTQINPNLAAAWYGKGVALGELGRYDEALKCFDETIKINPNDAEAWFNKGVTLGELGRYDEALKCYDRTTKINPNSDGAWYNKGVILGELGKHDEALKCYDRTTKINPNSDGAWYNKGVILGKLGKHDEALKCFDGAIKINPDYAKAWYNKGVTLGKLGKHDEELKCYDKTIRTNPNDAKAWFNKGVALGELGKHNEELKCYNETIRLNPNNAKAWFNRGGALRELGKHDEALKCYDETIRINPNDAEAWHNKGTALGKLGKLDEELKCYDRAIKINPNLAEAWYNKGITLGKLGKHDEALKCYDETIRINPNYAKAYGNLGIDFLNLHRYEEAVTQLRKAKELFSEQGHKDDAAKARELELLAQNASELMSKMEPLDEQFRTCLTSQGLVELKDQSLAISKSAESLVKQFRNKDLPEDAMELLVSKEACFTTLSASLRFEEVDLNGLSNARKVFEEWKLDDFVTALNSLENFVRSLQKFGSLDEIPERSEGLLLQVLSAALLLDGVLTREISSRIKAEPFEAKPTTAEKVTEIQRISIEDTKDAWVRVCLVQLDFPLTQKFPYTLQRDQKSAVRKKVFEALQVARKEKVDIICFPELSFAKKWPEQIKEEYKDMIVICGSYYDDNNRNVCHIIINGQDYIYAKCNPSIFEKENGEGLEPGNTIFVFQTRHGKFSVLTCIDFEYEYSRISNEGGDIIINPRYDTDKDLKFQKRANLSIDQPDGYRCLTFFLQVNAKTAKTRRRTGGGGTCIIGCEHPYRIEKYESDGLSPKDENEYKICEARDEMMLIANLCIDEKEGTKAGKKTETGNWYKHDGKRWKLLEKKSIWLAK